MHCLLSIFCCVFSRLWTWWKKRVRIYSFSYKSFLSQGLFGGNTRPQRLTCYLLTNSPSERQTKATNKMSWVTQTEMTSLQSRRLFLPVISTCVTVILLIGWWGPPAFHQSKSNTNLVLTTGRGQHSVCQDRETILLAVNPKQKMQRLYVMYLLIYFFIVK